ncbi:oxygenase [Streptomyces cellostaticus]|uniref:Oxygenase n=1 Tax=Streptomyces cellostaticus TaxID=67285 RepID=A0A101N5L0_9ACTN|nr:FAD-dependent oxidoreductase [Streptomyces cellostaticus]KUM86953.1 oxygenase [Streptomyces cellostaticus]GHI10374.1 FAD-binding monooxygenase [Streptomyces cellostaticus]
MVNTAEQPSAPTPSLQVLVVGAGPVGLTAAHELARRGLRVRLIDAAPGPATTSRAVATHPRTLETYDQMGVVDDVLPRGRRNQAFTMYAGGRRRVRLEADYATMPTRYPYTLVVEQTETEAALRSAVARLGVRVEWGVRLEDFAQNAELVRARLVHADGREEMCTASWLVGCDGGHSTVRKCLGLELLGESSETWMLADAPVDTEVEPDSIYWAHTGGQALMMVPYARDGYWRLLDTVPAASADEPGRAEEQFSRKLSAGLGHRVRVGEASWTSVFTFQQRMVERMQDGRVLVAGDAAHVHSPASGQGMNTGIQEAYNLAWKLAMVEQGHAGPELLETYSEERVPLGAALLGSTRTATVLVQLKNALAGVVLPHALRVVNAVRPLRRAVQRKVLGGMSGLKISYDASSLTGADPYKHRAGAGSVLMSARQPDRGPAPGARVTAARVHGADETAASAFRAELRDPRWTLLLAAGGHGPGDVPVGVAVTAAAQYGEWLSVRTVGGSGPDGPAPLADPDRRLRTALGLRPGAWILVRPDGYVAARGTLLTRPALRRALAPLVAPVPLADEARREPQLAARTATHDLEEH